MNPSSPNSGPPHRPSPESLLSEISQLKENHGNEGLVEEHFRSFYLSLIRQPGHAPNFSKLPDIFDQTEHESNQTTNEQVVGVIVESRPHALLPEVVFEFSKQLNIPIQLYHGPSATSYIKHSCLEVLIQSGRVVLTELLTDVLFPPLYNTLLLSRIFWDSLIGRNKILIFQTDAILCGASPYKLNDFLEFDYIGSKWSEVRPVGVRVAGGNGGFSLRDWQYSVQSLNQFYPHLWSGAEDTYFSFHMSMLGANVAQASDCAKFGTQHEFLCDSFGAHKIGQLPLKQQQRFLNYCPQAERLFE